MYKINFVSIGSLGVNSGYIIDINICNGKTPSTFVFDDKLPINAKFKIHSKTSNNEYLYEIINL